MTIQDCWDRVELHVSAEAFCNIACSNSCWRKRKPTHVSGSAHGNSLTEAEDTARQRLLVDLETEEGKVQRTFCHACSLLAEREKWSGTITDCHGHSRSYRPHR